MKQISAAQSPVLNDELIAEILSRLPVKSLIRFMCVCKYWNSLVSDSNFVKLHLHRSVARNTDFIHLRLLFHGYTASQEAYALCCRVSSLLQHKPSSIIHEQHPLKDKYQVVGPCNGLFCLSAHLENKPYHCWVRLWNPATRSRSRKSPTLNFNGYFTQFGFGYDHSSDTYKVVAFSRGNMSVYSMGANCWRSIQSFPAHRCIEAKDGVYVSGTLNWLAFLDLNPRGTYLLKPSAPNNQVVIVSLHLGMETNSQLSLPRGIDENLRLGRDPALGVLKDRLCFYHDHNRTHFVLWQMKEFGIEESWTCLMNVRYDYLQPVYPSIFIPTCMSDNDDILMLSHFHNECRTILYNQRDGRLERFETLDHHCAKYYIESLVSPC